MRRTIMILPLLAGALAGAIVALVIGSSSSTRTVTLESAAPGAPAPAASAVPTSQSRTSASGLSVNQIYKKDSAGVVDITVTSTTSNSGSNGFGFGFGGGTQQQEDEGAGVVYDTKGDILTDEHVVAGANPKVEVHFQNGVNAPATIVGTDASTDVAVIHVNVPSSQLHPIAFANSSTAQVGDPVVAIGSPFSLPETVTAGIVSAVGRAIQAPNNYTITGAIQTDAAINPGNSGGPLLDANGDVLGLNDQIQTSSGSSAGIGFATPGNTDVQVADEMINHQTVEHAYVGVCVANPISGAGAEVASGSSCPSAVVAGSPAAKAGLAQGDVITAINGRSVASSDAFVAVISNYKPGDTITMTIHRVHSSKTRTVKVTLGNRPASAPTTG
ncbi:MAG TPA: trypsin-like peptidase domain-containing protein [Solirubrobacteraceae bacterium]|nr:trypsin-like peptidase domain-containing protein [Solirubrobacteraceae bacterium]